jgi:sugar/nucleoside kinase (ribokinase family)
MEARRVNSIDDTGAGDAFCAGVVAGILQEKKSEEVLQMGIVNGASEVTKMGVKNGLLSEKEMVRWMKKKLKVVEEKV